MTKYVATILKAMCKATGNSENRHMLFLKQLPFTYYVNKKKLVLPLLQELFFLYFVFSVSKISTVKSVNQGYTCANFYFFTMSVSEDACLAKHRQFYGE